MSPLCIRSPERNCCQVETCHKGPEFLPCPPLQERALWHFDRYQAAAAAVLSHLGPRWGLCPNIARATSELRPLDNESCFGCHHLDLAAAALSPAHQVPGCGSE